MSLTEDAFTLRDAHAARAVTGVGFSPSPSSSSQKLASVCSQSLVVWDAVHFRELLHVAHRGQQSTSPVTSVEWDPSSGGAGAERVALTFRTEKLVRLWDLRTKRDEQVSTDKVDQCSAAVWLGSQQQHMLVLRGERSVGLLDLRKSRALVAHRKFDYAVNDCHVTEANMLLVTNARGEVEFLNLANVNDNDDNDNNGSLLATENRLQAHARQAGLVRTAGNKTMITTGDDALVQLWDAGDLSCVGTVDSLMFPPRCLAVSSPAANESRWMAVSADKSLHVVDLQQQQQQVVLSPVLASVQQGGGDELGASSSSVSAMAFGGGGTTSLLAYCLANSPDVYIQQVSDGAVERAQQQQRRR